MRAYMQSMWMKLADRVKAGSLTKDKAIKMFEFNFGTHDKVCSLHKVTLTVRRMPPEPD